MSEPSGSNSRTPAMLRVLGTRVHMVQMREALETIERWIVNRDVGRYVVATGMHGIMEGRRDPAFQAILNRADLFIPDGYSLVWIARRRGIPLSERVCGPDLLLAFCRIAAEKGYRVFFYGDTEDVLTRLRRRLEATCPGLQIAGTCSPPFRPLSSVEDEQIVEMINASSPDALWVGLGLPKQERWIATHKDRLHVPVLVASGAAFKFASGAVKRVPRWAGEHGLEWLWRFLHEPRRLWRRALVDVPAFALLVGLEFMAEKLVAIHDAAKRLFDLFLSTTGLIVSAPFWMAIACLIKLEDRGSVFYVQERVGRGGRRFRSVKFRSMIVDADQRYGPRQAEPKDARITRVGRILRATAMDELPQLWNIARGDMSFVGPRALATGEIEVNGSGAYVPLDAIPGYEARQQVRPGLTGIAQIYAPRDLERRKKFRYDRFYISRRSFWLDLRLIVLSVWITLRGKWESRANKL